MVELNVLSLEPSGAHRAEAEAAGQELQPHRGEQRGGLEGGAGAARRRALLAALLLHARDQHHDLVQRFQTQLQNEGIRARLATPVTGLQPALTLIQRPA